MTAKEIRGFELHKNSSDWNQDVFLQEIAAQLAEKNDLLRECNQMQAEQMENWKQDAAERSAAMQKFIAKELTGDDVIIGAMAQAIEESTMGEFDRTQAKRMVYLVLTAYSKVTK